MSRQTLLELARQGNPHAIAHLITQALHEKGISARASLKGDCLRLILEATQVPSQAAMVWFIRLGMEKLGVETIKRVKIYGRQTGQTAVAWSQVLDLQAPPADQDAASIASRIFPSPDSFLLAQPISPARSDSSVDRSNAEQMITLKNLHQTRAASQIQRSRTSPTPPASGSNSLGFKKSNANKTSPEVFWNSLKGVYCLQSSHLKSFSWVTQILISLLWLWVGLNSIQTIYSIAWALSYSLYTQVDSTTATHTLANLLYTLWQQIDRLLTPFRWVSSGIYCITLSMLLVWVYQLHLSLRRILNDYPITTGGAIARILVPLFNFWGIWNLLATLADRLKSEGVVLMHKGEALQRIIPWLYIFTFTAVGLNHLHWLGLRAVSVPWLFVCKNSVMLAISLALLRLVRITNWAIVQLANLHSTAAPMRIRR